MEKKNKRSLSRQQMPIKAFKEKKEEEVARTIPPNIPGVEFWLLFEEILLTYNNYMPLQTQSNISKDAFKSNKPITSTCLAILPPYLQNYPDFSPVLHLVLILFFICRHSTRQKSPQRKNNNKNRNSTLSTKHINTI